jgi:hypothetical protein
MLDLKRHTTTRSQNWLKSHVSNLISQMIKRIIYCITAISLAVLGSCKDSSKFTVSGTITNPGTFKKVYLMQADSTTVSVVDSTNLLYRPFQCSHRQ